MTDIVERLLAPAPHPVIGCECELCELSRLRNDADREIERLRTERNLWKERTEQGSLIIMGNVAENERLREQVAALQASSGYEASIAQVEIERLRAENNMLRSLIVDAPTEAERDELIARRALENKP
jgi:hypothetical protein